MKKKSVIKKLEDLEKQYKRVEEKLECSEFNTYVDYKTLRLQMDALEAHFAKIEKLLLPEESDEADNSVEDTKKVIILDGKFRQAE